MSHFERLYWMCYNVDSVFYILVFDHEAYEILAPWPGIEPTPPSLEGEVLTTGPPGKTQVFSLLRERLEVFKHFSYYKQIISSFTQGNNNTSTNTLCWLLIWYPDLCHGYIWINPGGSGKELTCQCRRPNRHGFDPWVGKSPWRKAWQPIPIFLPEESHGQRSLAGYSHGVAKSWIQLKQLHMHTHLTFSTNLWS